MQPLYVFSVFQQVWYYTHTDRIRAVQISGRKQIYIEDVYNTDVVVTAQYK